MINSDKVVKLFSGAQDRLVLQAADLSLETIASMVEKGSIDVAPEFQRRERWPASQQSALIESFLLNVPVPPVYLAEDDFGTYSVIDGKQRITSIKQFMRDELALTQLDSFKEIEGYYYRDLPRQLRNALEVRPYLRVVTLLKQSDSTLKYEVFTRLNQGGEPLNPQEIRNVAFRGPLNDLMLELSGNGFLRNQLKIKGKSSSAYREMADVEYVLRFFTLRESWRNFTGGLRPSMDSFMIKHRDVGQSTINNYRSAFYRCVEVCENLWGDKAFKRYDHGNWRHQMLAGMYDAQMLAVDSLDDNQLAALDGKSREAVAATRALFEHDSDFEEAVRRATNTPSRIIYRVNAMRDALLGL